MARIHHPFICFFFHFRLQEESDLELAKEAFGMIFRHPLIRFLNHTIYNYKPKLKQELTTSSHLLISRRFYTKSELNLVGICKILHMTPQLSLNQLSLNLTICWGITYITIYSKIKFRPCLIEINGDRPE